MTPDVEARVREAVSAVQDPEIPVPLSDLGVLRKVEIDVGQVRILLRPTRLACPGRERMRRDVEEAVRAVAPEAEVRIEWEMSGWTAQQVSPEGRTLLADLGFSVLEHPTCPYCGGDSRRDAEFGGSVCKRPFTCRACGSTWDQVAGVPVPGTGYRQVKLSVPGRPDL